PASNVWRGPLGIALPSYGNQSDAELQMQCAVRPVQHLEKSSQRRLSFAGEVEGAADRPARLAGSGTRFYKWRRSDVKPGGDRYRGSRVFDRPIRRVSYTWLLG